MKLEIDLKVLNLSRERMRAPLIQWIPTEPGLVDFTAIELELLAGVEQDIRDVETHNGVFTVKGYQVLVYIKDHSRRPDVEMHPEEGNRFHFLNCRTLQDMASKGRYGRYVTTNRRDGVFKLDVLASPYSASIVEKDLPICPCKNCLKELNYKSAANSSSLRNTVFRSFNVEEFFSEYRELFLPKTSFTDDTVPINSYVRDWSRISTGIRERASWVCSSCDVNLSQHHHLLHVHHIDGQRGNNRPSNLKPLCEICHSIQPGHDHMKVSMKSRTQINQLRRAQNK